MAKTLGLRWMRLPIGKMERLTSRQVVDNRAHSESQPNAIRKPMEVFEIRVVIGRYIVVG
jgi:hypothetical protein